MTTAASAASTVALTAALSAALTAALTAAADPSTTPAALHRLIRHRNRDVRRLVAMNPNTSLDDLDHLALVFTDEVASNAVLDWLALEDANWIASRRASARERMLMSPASPSGLRWWAVRFGTDEDRLAVASNPATDAAMIDGLRASGGPVAAAAAQHIHSTKPPDPGDNALARALAEAMANPGGADDELADLVALDAIPRWLMRTLMDAGGSDVRRAIAANTRTPPLVLARLLLDADDLTSRRAQANRSTPYDALDRWHRLRTYDPNLTSAELDSLARGGDIALLLIARHPNASDAIVRRCVTHTDWRIRHTAAIHQPTQSLRPHLWALANDPDRDVRAAIISRRMLPSNVAVAMTLDADDLVADAATRALAYSAEPLTPIELGRLRSPLARRADAISRRRPNSRWIRSVRASTDPLVRAALVRNPDLPASSLAALASDPAPVVRTAVARRSVDPAVLQGLAADPDAAVRLAIAENPATPLDVIARLTDDADDALRGAVLQRADPVQIARLLGIETGATAVSAVVDVVAGATPGPDVPPELWDCEWFALALSNGPASSAATLALLASATSWRVRRSVARHVRTGQDTLRVLASDPDNDVRAAVAIRDDAPVEIVCALANDPDEKVRKAVLQRTHPLARTVLDALLNRVGEVSDTIALARCSDHPGAARVLALLCGEALGEADLLRFALGDARLHVARHPDAGEHVLRDLATDSSWQVRECVAAHPHTPLDAVRALAEDTDRDVRAAVAARTDADADLLATLRNDSDTGVRRAAIINVSAGASEARRGRERRLIALARSRTPVVEALALGAAELDARERSRRYHHSSIHWLVRAAAAAQVGLPDPVRSVLAADANRMVRDIAEGRQVFPTRAPRPSRPDSGAPSGDAGPRGVPVAFVREEGSVPVNRISA